MKERSAKRLVKLECPSEQAANEIGWRFKGDTLVMGSAVVVRQTTENCKRLYRQQLRLEAKRTPLSDYDKEAAARAWPYPL